MTDLRTSGVQPIIPSETSAYIILESIHDILKYLDYDIVIKDKHAFLNRPDISLDVDEKLNLEKKQFFTNALLISGLIEMLDDNQYDEVESQFNKMIETLSSLIHRKLKRHNLTTSHSVFIHKDDCDDILIGFIKNNDCWKEYNDETGYLKLCSSS